MMSTRCSKHIEARNKYIKKEFVKLAINQNIVYPSNGSTFVLLRSFSRGSCKQTRSSVFPHIANNICLHCCTERQLPVTAAGKTLNYRSHLPRGLRNGAAAAHLLGLQVRIPPEAWISACCVCVVCCQVEVSASGRSLFQRMPTDCGVCNWVWSRKLVNDEAYAHQGCRATNQNNNQQSFTKIYLSLNFFL
jgi:hypothetical protein